MKIKQFVDAYKKNATENLKDKYINDNLKIKKYIPFIEKDVLTNRLIDCSLYEYENYETEDGTIKRRKTNNIKVNSVVQYLLFCRVIIENYTNLEVETEGFFEEYDLLKESGLLDKLMIGSENKASLIPIGEITEVRTILDMKQNDTITNCATPQSYISSQVERFGTLLGVTLKPVLERAVDSLENMDDKDIEKLGKKLDKVIKLIK